MGLDWSLLESFLSVAEAGSTSAAATKAGTSQPTMSRRIQQLEEALGVTLFVRHARGLVLTERGQELLASTKALRGQVDEVMRRASGMRESPRGVVRVSVNEPLGIYVLPQALARLYDAWPEIEVELAIDNRAADLSRREADIAVRMFEPAGADLIAKKLGEVGLGMFASPDYIERHGSAVNPLDAAGHVLVGHDRDEDFRRAIARLGLNPSAFALRTDSLTAQLEAVRHGVAVGGTHLALGARLGLVRVLEQLPLAPLPMWLVTHAELRTSAAVRTVHVFLREVLEAYLKEPGNTLLSSSSQTAG